MATAKTELKKKIVYILTRKQLRINTRLFKQARSLAGAGYEVKMIGTWDEGLAFQESRDGYEIIRLRLNPLYRTLPGFINKFLISFEFAFKISLELIDYIIVGFHLKRIREVLREAGSPIQAYVNIWLSLGNSFKSRYLKRDSVEDKMEEDSEESDETTPKLVKSLIRSIMRANLFIYRKSRQSIFLFRWPLMSIDYYFRSFLYITRNLPKPDIIHANDLDTLLVSTVLAKRFRAKLLYDAQELYTGLHTLPFWYRKWLSFQEYVLVRQANRVTVVNDAIAEAMESKYKVQIDKVILNCPPYHRVFSNDGRISIRKKLCLEEGIPIYLYSGGLRKQRGIENTILALQYLKEGVLVILGEGPLKDDLIDLIKTKNLEKRVFFSKFVPHTEVPSFISSADVGVIPYENVGINHYLCSPSKLFHYIMAELPVACSDFPFLRKVVLENGLGSTFDPAVPASIAEAMESLISNKRRYEEIKIDLLKAKKKYCWENEEMKFLRIFNDL